MARGYTRSQDPQKPQRFDACAEPPYKLDPYKILDFDSVCTQSRSALVFTVKTIACFVP